MPNNAVFRERTDGTIERVWPHNGQARVRLSPIEFEQVLRHSYPYWSEKKIQRALAHPWRFRRDVNWALAEILEQRLAGLAPEPVPPSA